MPNSQLDILIKILLDKSIDAGVRDDAAMDLGAYNSDAALNALVQVAKDQTEYDIILYSCGSSIAEIWVARGRYSRKVLDSLTAEARQEVNIDPDRLEEADN